MLTVYCEKMATGAFLSPGMYGLFGVVIGALLSGGMAYLIQKQNSKHAIKLEKEKNKISIISSFLLQDVVSFLNDEIDSLQSIYLSDKDGSEIPSPEHHKNIVNNEVNIRIFKDEELTELFLDFINAGNVVRSMSAAEKLLGDIDALRKVIDLAADIKKRILEHCQFNIK